MAPSSSQRNPLMPFYVILGLVAVGGVIVLLNQMRGGGGDAAVAPVAVQLDPAQLSQVQGIALGRADAPVVLYEFADFQCPACQQFATFLTPLIKDRLVSDGTVRFVYYDFPLSQHPHAFLAARAGRCANEQGKFWEYHDLLFQRQDEWNGEATRNPKSNFKGYAGAIGLNIGQWEQCFDSQKYLRQIQANAAEGVKRNVGGTPTFLIGNKLHSNMGYDEFKKLGDEEFQYASQAPATPTPSGDTAAGKAVPIPGAAKRDTAAAKRP